MKILNNVGVAGLLVLGMPALSMGKGIPLGNSMPSPPPAHLVRYRFAYTRLTTGTGQVRKTMSPKAPDYSGNVDIAIDHATLYYREYRGDQLYREVLYDRNEHKVLLFNHPQNRLNLFSELPYDAVPFIPFPFEDEEIGRIVELTPVKKWSLSAKDKNASLPGTLSESMQSVPVRFQVMMTPPPSVPQVNTFSIRTADGEVAGWAFTYASKNPLPASITKRVARPIMTEEDKQKFLQHKVVPATHWRPEAEIHYAFMDDQEVPEGDIPSAESLFRSANEQTIIVDRCDLKNPISFPYRKAGGELEEQIQAARRETTTAGARNNLLRSGWPFLLAPLALGLGWGVRRRITRPSKTKPFIPR